MQALVAPSITQLNQALALVAGRGRRRRSPCTTSTDARHRWHPSSRRPARGRWLPRRPRRRRLPTRRCRCRCPVHPHEAQSVFIDGNGYAVLSVLTWDPRGHRELICYCRNRVRHTVAEFWQRRRRWSRPARSTGRRRRSSQRRSGARRAAAALARARRQDSPASGRRLRAPLPSRVRGHVPPHPLTLVLTYKFVQNLTL